MDCSHQPPCQCLGHIQRPRHLVRAALPLPPFRLQIMSTISPLHYQWPTPHSRGETGTQKPSCTAAYTEVVHWKTSSQYPMEMRGKHLLSKLYRAFVKCTALESIALKATTVMSVLLLQKPAHKSKPKDH